VAFEGFRCPAYQHSLESDLVRELAGAHRDVQGSDRPPDTKLSTATTDARYVDGDCSCYGPSAGNIHGIDEWVDLASTRDTALTVALAAARWCA
jgi:acetylornithine deacetylase